MPRTGSATHPLHYGKAPRWLFKRMNALSGRSYTFIDVMRKAIESAMIGNRDMLEAVKRLNRYFSA